jgi:excisionase family DNA binding protein
MMTEENSALMMTIDEVAEYLNLHPLTVRRLARDGKIPAFKVGRQWRVKRGLLDQWIEENSRRNVEVEE